MKLLLSLLAGCLFATAAHAAADAPAVSVDQALALANKALARKGVSGVYIESIELSKPTLLSKKWSWSVRWSAPLPASRPEIKEVGLSIDMDGKVVHVVKAPRR